MGVKTDYILNFSLSNFFHADYPTLRHIGACFRVERWLTSGNKRSLHGVFTNFLTLLGEHYALVLVACAELVAAGTEKGREQAHGH